MITDKNSVLCYDTLRFALKYYNPKQLEHVLKVAQFAIEKPTDRICGRKLWKLGVLHDILEDTSCTKEDLKTLYDDNFIESIVLLTHDKEKESYEDYIIKIFSSNDYNAQEIKRADMKDHLLREETLSQNLKDKYYPIIKYLL